MVQANMAELAEQVARGLSKASTLDGRAFIRTPVLFPSGSTIVVAIEEEGGDRYRLSDLGQGEDEADLLDIVAIYRHQAEEVAELTGVLFDGRAFVLTRATVGQLVGATMAIANAVSRALDRAQQRADQRQHSGAIDRMVSRLSRIFSPQAVARNAEVRGFSTHAWTVDAEVRSDGRRIVFDYVTPHPASVAFATTKFHDLARLEDAPVRVGVVHKKQGLGTFLMVVSQAAKVIEDEAGDRTWRRAAEIEVEAA
jgi:hypothetical protein